MAYGEALPLFGFVLVDRDDVRAVGQLHGASGLTGVKRFGLNSRARELRVRQQVRNLTRFCLGDEFSGPHTDFDLVHSTSGFSERYFRASLISAAAGGGVPRCLDPATIVNSS